MRVGDLRLSLRVDDLKDRFVYPRPVLDVGPLVLKGYNMIIEGGAFDRRTIPTDSDIGEGILDMTRTNPGFILSGVGFFIYSPGYLNIAQWCGEDSIVPLNFAFAVDSIGKVDFSKVGGLSLCVWENGIRFHEDKSWLRFCRSDKTETDFQKYLRDSYQGELQR